MQSNLSETTKPSLFARFAGLGKAVDLTSDVIGFAGGVLLLLSSLTVTYEVFARYIMKSPTKWTFEISILLILTAVFTTVSYGLKEKGHVIAEILVDKLPARPRAILDSISYLFITIFSVFYIIPSIQMVADSLTKDERSPLLNLPMWPTKTVILIAFIVLAVQAFRMFLAVACPLFWSRPDLRTNLKYTAVIVIIYAAAISLGLIICSQVDKTTGIVFLLITLLLAGVPIGFSIAVAGTFGAVTVLGMERGIIAIPQIYYLVWNDFTIIALPLFIFLGYIMHKTGLADELFGFARVWLGHLPGGLAVATLVVCGIFSAVSGSSIANAVTVGLVAIPAMVRYKYDKKMAAGLVAVGGTLGVLIPPSTAMLLIGIMSGESIGHLFMAGVMPGALCLALLAVTAIIVCKKTGSYEPLPRASFSEALKETKKSIGVLLMPVIMLGGIYLGIFTPTEAAGVAIVYTMALALFTRRIKWLQMYDIIKSSTKTVAMIAILVAAGMALANMTAMLQLPQMVTEYVVSSGMPGWAVIVSCLLVLVLLDVFLDAGAITILTIPIMAPVIMALGYDMLWFAVLFVLTTEIGLITPPIGMNAFVVQQVSGVSLMDILRGSFPFLIVLVITIILVAIFPGLATWLPSTM